MSLNESFEKDFMDKLYNCYDREIKNLWQRSIFLGAFLLATFTAYGGMWKLIVKGDIKPQFLCCVKIGLVFISFLGYVLSVLWVMMAKGSKGLQELYEAKIRIFDSAFGIDTDVLRSVRYFDEELLKEYYGSDAHVLSRLNYDAEYRKEYLSWINRPDKKLCTHESGAFSVSKINILLGQVFMLFWAVNNVVCVCCCAFEIR